MWGSAASRRLALAPRSCQPPSMSALFHVSHLPWAPATWTPPRCRAAESEQHGAVVAQPLPGCSPASGAGEGSAQQAAEAATGRSQRCEWVVRPAGSESGRGGCGRPAGRPLTKELLPWFRGGGCGGSRSGVGDRWVGSTDPCLVVTDTGEGPSAAHLCEEATVATWRSVRRGWAPGLRTGERSVPLMAGLPEAPGWEGAERDLNPEPMPVAATERWPVVGGDGGAGSPCWGPGASGACGLPF